MKVACCIGTCGFRRLSAEVCTERRGFLSSCMPRISANNLRTQSESSTRRGRSIPFPYEAWGSGRPDRQLAVALVNSGPRVVSCVSRELRVGLSHVSWELQTGRDRARAPRVLILRCIGRHLFIGTRRLIGIDYDSDGVSCDCSSASHQNGCESRRRAARGYV